MKRLFLLVLAVCAGEPLLLPAEQLSIVRRAFGHDHLHPANNEWLKSLTSKSKTLCCNGDDADQPDDWEASGDRYRVKVDGVWYDVPEAALVDAPNRSGGALVWVNRGYMGKSIRCFMPGTLS